MKKTIFTVMLTTLLLGVLPVTTLASPGRLWVGSFSTDVWTSSANNSVNGLPHLESAPFVVAAISKFEGTLTAYSHSSNPNVEKQVFAASDDISASLESLNAELREIYPSLSEEQQLAVEDAYLSLDLYLQNLATEANLILGEGNKSSNRFEVIDDDEKINENSPGRLWVSSASAI